MQIIVISWKLKIIIIKPPTQPATASNNRKQMLQEARVSGLGAALEDSLSSHYGSCTTSPSETPSVGGFASAAVLLQASRS